MPRSLTVPKPYEKAGQLCICLRDPKSKRRKTVYCGAVGTAEARRTASRAIADWEAADRVIEPPAKGVRRKVSRPESVTVAKVVVGYWLHVKGRHQQENGKPTSHGHAIRTALRELRQHAGDYAALDYGPKLLQETRRRLIGSNRFNRKTINQHVQTIVRAFRWAVSEELVPASVPDALSCLDPLKRGEIEALREGKKVRPVLDADIAS
ncbi:MAG: hypothetical protein AAGH92_13095, partial [Planctomycetota bacterium]